MGRTPVKPSEILKITVLLAILVSLPRIIHLYQMISEGQSEFSAAWVVDFIFRTVFLLLFSWSILQINANLGYMKLKVSVPIRIMGLVLVNLGFLFLMLTIWQFLYPLIVDISLSRQDEGFLFFRYAILHIVSFFIARILRLQTDQHENRMENEYLKQQSLQNELAALKNQIDPHFLFNSLNSLTSLIRDNERASLFVKKLSHMYRYILQSGDCDFVTVSDELKFLESYTYLIQTRYRDRFSIDIDIESGLLERKIPPLALQVLVENAVKHNEISGSNPLAVQIFSREGYLYVENRMRPRSTLAEGTGNGLQNLKKRYLLLRKQALTVSTENNIFSVKLPLNKVA